MKILITGATGFVGRNLCEALYPHHEIYILTRRNSDISSICFDHQYIFEDDIESLEEYLRINKIDGIVHLAAFYTAEHNKTQIFDLIRSNIFFGTAVLEAASNAGVKWFLNIGTIWQNYNSPDYKDVYNPVNLYAATKQAFMTMAKYYEETTPIRFCTLKLCDTYGPYDNRRKIFSLFDEISKSNKPLEMSQGEQLIDIVHIDTVCTEIIKLISLLSEPTSSLREEYVVTSGRQISLRQLAAEYEQSHNVKLNIIWGGRPYRKREVMKPYIGNTI